MSDLSTEETDAAAGPIPERLKELVAVVGGRNAAAKIAGAAPSTIDLWVAGKSRVPFAGMSRLVRAGDRSLDWLAGMPERDAAQMQMQSLSASVPDGFITVPALEVRASAGRGWISGPYDTYSGRVIALREDMLRAMGLIPGKTEALRAVGDSMEPMIRDGDMMLIDRSISQVVDNGIYVLVYGGAVLVKRVQLQRDRSVILRSENPIYSEETVPPDEVDGLIIEGRVRWFGRTI